MRTRTVSLRLLIGLALFLFQVFTANITYAASIDLTSIEELLKNQKYSVALEKALTILNTKQSLLSPIEAGKLHYLIGVAYKKNGNADMAVNYLKKIEIQFPASEYLKQSLLELADIYKEEYFQKEAYLEKVFDKYPQSPEAVYAGIELSKDYFTLKNYKKAVPIIEKMVKTWNVGEQYPELEMLLAIVYAGTDDNTQAAVYLEKAEKKIPTIINSNPSYLFEAGKIHHHNRDHQKAADYLTKLINVYPTFKDIDEAAITLSQSYQQQKNSYMSAIYLIKILAANPQDQKKKYGLLLNLGKILGTLKQEELEKIKTNYPLYCDSKRLLAMVKENSPDSDQKKTAAILLGGEFQKTGNFAQANEDYYHFLEKKRDPLVEKLFRENLDMYLDALRHDKNYDEVFKFWALIKGKKSYLSGANLMKLGAVLYDMQLYGNAHEIYSFMDQYTMFSQYWPEVRRQLARLYIKMEQYDEYLDIRAKIVIDDASEAEKSEFLYYTLRAYKKTANSEEVKNLIKTVAINPRQIENIYQYQVLELKAETLAEEKDPASGAAALELYNELFNYKGSTASQRSSLLVKNADLNYNLGNWQAALDNYNNAEEYLANETATENKEWILFRKISIHRNTDRPEEAQKTLAELRKLNPASFWLRQAEKRK
ncbi:MAG: Tetratricopeptide repeat protein [Acidobacteriota bacterium]|nr:Tetratricopeptide repeat protein [Acidobacteriota bacterium]